MQVLSDWGLFLFDSFSVLEINYCPSLGHLKAELML